MIKNVSVPEFRGYPVMMPAKPLNAEAVVATTSTEIAIPDHALVLVIVTANTTYSTLTDGVFIDAVERAIPVAGLTSIFLKNSDGANTQYIWGMGE